MHSLNQSCRLKYFLLHCICKINKQLIESFKFITFDRNISIRTHYFCYILRREYKRILERNTHLVAFNYSCFYVCDFAIGNRTLRIV